MKVHFVLIASLAVLLSGCAITKPEYEVVTNFSPDCANMQAQVRYLNKMKRFSAYDETDKKYNGTIDIQIERLQYYCQYEH